VEIGTFREDLFYRLNVVDIYIPPLRKRREDIPPLINYFLDHFCKKYGVTRQLTESAVQILKDFEWKGNVRELRHLIERLVVMVDSLVIDVTQLPKNIFGIVDSSEAAIMSVNATFDEKMELFESYLIHDAYQKYGSSRKIAEHLSISQTKANNLIRKYITGDTKRKL